MAPSEDAAAKRKQPSTAMGVSEFLEKGTGGLAWLRGNKQQALKWHGVDACRGITSEKASGPQRQGESQTTVGSKQHWRMEDGG
eukprot:scaffold204038_cov47-Prasinocladus_malaysianus.AAC.2